MQKSAFMLTQGAIIAAAYIILTLPFAQFAFGPIQFRLAEALTVLAALTPAAIPGLFLGCLFTNLLYPSGLGIIDIVFGSLATLVAAWMTWQLRRRLSERSLQPWLQRIIILLPAAIINALVVGFYLPFLLPDTTVSLVVIATFMLTIFLSECVVIYLIGLPLLLALQKSALIRQETKI